MGALPHISYIGVCGTKGYGWSEIGYRFEPFWSESLKTGMDFTKKNGYEF